MNDNHENIDAEIKLHIKTSEKLENFWYHYKWHTIIAVFVLICALILTLQLCTKERYDVDIIYAGEVSISTSSVTGSSSQYLMLTDDLKTVTDDCNNDGNVNVNLQNLYILDAEQLTEVTSRFSDPMKKSQLESTVQENRDAFYNSIMYGGYYLCLLSESLFLEYEALYEESIFVDIEDYAKDGGSYEYASEHGIYLSSLGIFSLPTVSQLPENTVVCLRKPGMLGQSDDGSAYKSAESTLKNLLSYGE
ncbi:MAG: hypothetical protein IJX92_03480 [Clostridia bacterium]|nr:hypothetical protein [Clostridia bacterium]